MFACLIASATPARAQDSGNPPSSPITAKRDMSTDRPDKTESAYTVDAGRIQIELDFGTYTRDRNEDVRSETFNIAPVNFKLGITRSTDIQFVFDSYLRQTVTDRITGARDRTEGVGDLTVRVKQNLWGNDGGSTALALMPFVKLPTNTNGLGNDAVEFGLIVPLAIGVSDHVGIGLMTEVDLLEEADGKGYAPSFVNSATIAFALTDRLGLYTELFTERSAESGSKWVITGDVGLTYALTEDIQLDGGMNLGITDAADDLNVFIGLSRRF